MDHILSKTLGATANFAPPQNKEFEADHLKSALKNLQDTSAVGLLEESIKTLGARAKLRDAESSGERSMARAVAIFNAWTGLTISAENGWRFMIALKQAREINGGFNRDDYVDMASYSSLLGEEAVK